MSEFDVGAGGGLHITTAFSAISTSGAMLTVTPFNSVKMNKISFMIIVVTHSVSYLESTHLSLTNKLPSTGTYTVAFSSTVFPTVSTATVVLGIESIVGNARDSNGNIDTWYSVALRYTTTGNVVTITIITGQRLYINQISIFVLLVGTSTGTDTIQRFEGSANYLASYGVTMVMPPDFGVDARWYNYLLQSQLCIPSFLVYNITQTLQSIDTRIMYIPSATTLNDMELLNYN
jgi:hypothetical protein